MTENNELTAAEKRRIRNLIKARCANYDAEYGCLPLDCECPMFLIGYRSSALCRYFRASVLPDDPALEAAFYSKLMKSCRQCGKPFPADGKRVYCSERCAGDARRRQTAARVRKHREKQM